jgi:hypothetical protein
LDAAAWDDADDECVDEAVFVEYQAEARQILQDAFDSREIDDQNDDIDGAVDRDRIRKPSPEIVDWMARQTAVMTRHVLDRLATLKPANLPDFRPKIDAKAVLDVAKDMSSDSVSYAVVLSDQTEAGKKKPKRRKRDESPAIAPRPPPVRMASDVVTNTRRRLNQIYPDGTYAKNIAQE